MMLKKKPTCLTGWLCAALGLVFWLWTEKERNGGVAEEGNGL